MNVMIETPVLIVRGGPVRMALALDLVYMGTDSMVVEQDSATGAVLHAKALTLNERTMEFCRRWNLIDKVASGYPDDHPRDNIFITGGINGQLIGRAFVPSTNERGVPHGGPEMLRNCAQHLFDPILAEAVEASQHSQMRYRTHFESFTQDSTGVTSTLTDVATPQEITIRSQYLVGCDGAASKVRKQLGVPFSLISQMDYSLSVMLRIENLEDYHPHGRMERFIFMDADGAWANLTMIDGVDLWRLTVVGCEERLDPQVYDPNPIIRRVLGSTPYQLLKLVPWRRSQCLAETYRIGRVLLAGDSAHTTSPTGGHGLNTGIGDAAEASWMLSGWGGKELLDAYTRERRTVAMRNFSNSTQIYQAWVSGGMANVERPGPEGAAARRNIGDYLGVALHQEWFSQGIGMGYCYEGSPIIVADGTARPPDHPSFYVPTARPGHRAPHGWLTDGRSVLDLFGRGFVLLRFRPDASDADSMAEAARKVGLPLTIVTIEQPEIAMLYQRQLILVRPDGMVAWRGDSLPENISSLVDVVRGQLH